MRNNNNHVLFVCSNPEVRDFLYKTFSMIPEFSKFYVEGTAVTRESGIQMSEEKRPGVVIFFEKTAGVEQISSAIYKIRSTGARVIYISSERYIGDPILEIIVGYGVYDIILMDEIGQEIIYDFLVHPRDFNDVSVFYREIKIDDDGGSLKSWKLPDLERARKFSTRLDVDYLSDPQQRMMEKIKPKIKDDEINVSIGSVIYKNDDESKIDERERLRRELYEKKKQKQIESEQNEFNPQLLDLSDEFDF